MKGFSVLFVCLAVAQAADTRGTVELHKNPIRRVVDMLQMMQSKVMEEGKTEKALYEKFSCWCKTGSSDLTASISAAEAKIGQLTTSIQEAEALSKQLGEELAQHKADRAEAKQAVADATALREKESATFAKDSSDLKTNIDALSKATAAIEKGVAGSFLQTSAAARLRQLTVDVEMSSVDRDVISAFLTGGQGQGYTPQSGQITGILKQMEDTMDKDLADITSTEETAIKDYNALVAAKTKEIAANSAAIEAKLSRKGNLEVEIVNEKEDLDDTGKALTADKEFLAGMEESCAKKSSEWEERSKTRTEELLAIADTIKLLNDDDALELFKKTLPSAASAALLQTAERSRDVTQRALKALGAAKGAKGNFMDSRLELITVALKGGSRSFDKVLTMIDDMVALLGKEQKADDAKKAYCLAELDKSED
jgi:peptidoglycan hydrolase CwlO-like protein